MKIAIKTISTLLAVLMMLGTFSCFAVLGTYAAETDQVDETDKAPDSIDYTQEVFNNPEEALAWMNLYMSNDNYEFYINEYTGVFALKNIKTGQITFSNPYDVASGVPTGSAATKGLLLSQIQLKYVDNSKPTEIKEMNSYTHAVLNSQVTVKKVKTGVRVEYTIGNESIKKLVPRLISAENFETLLVQPLSEALDSFLFNKFLSFYEEQNIAKAKSQREREAMLRRFPKAADMVLYSLDVEATLQDLNLLEDMIKGYCPDYTFDQMDADHEMTGYEAENDLSPVFKMALEYTLNEDGLTARLPTNGLRFNSTLYSLESLEILPYFGAGNSYNDGYTFYPDGSGAIFKFKELAAGGRTTTFSRPIYGHDYALHELDGTYQKAIRLPVYGIQSDDAYYQYTISTVVKDEETGAEDIVETTYRVSITVVHTKDEMLKQIEEDLDAGVYGEDAKLVSDIETLTESRGFLAVIEEGESLCSMATYHPSAVSDYHTVKTSFNPRPKDKYLLNNGNEMSVVSDRKYTGNFKIRYIMLNDEELSQESGFAESDGYYEPSYLGMANAYSAYLVANGVLERLTEAELQSDIPLYIESFGAMEVTEQILSFPVDVMKPMTTFKDIETMYGELSDLGVKNINFRLTGFANGGMYSTVPNKLKWENAVGGKSGMKELLAYADGINGEDGKHLGIYPDFDFLYVNNTSLFDGLDLKRDAIRTVNNRYASKKEYSATLQTYVSYYVLALSPAYISRFYNKLLDAYDAYAEYQSLGISASTLGTDLFSDFDKEEPYNREDSKRFIKEALSTFDTKEGLAGVMTNGGNAYTLQYVDHLLGVSLDSSRYMKASASVPFVGMALHGYLQFAGTPLNMEGDINYAMLKAIENGASPYFVLSYRNTNILKKDFYLSSNYSVNYNIWKEDVVRYYKELNEALGDVQANLIINHEFLDGTRVMDVSEIESAMQGALNTNDDYEQAYEETSRLEHIAKIAAARAAAKNAVATMEETLKELQESVASYETIMADMLKRIERCDAAKALYEEKLADPRTTATALAAYLSSYNGARNDVRNMATQGVQIAVDAMYAYESVVALQQTAETAVVLLTEVGAAEDLILSASEGAEAAKEYLADIKEQADICASFTESIYETASVHISREEIDERVSFYEDEEIGEEGEQEQTATVRNNGNIVAVTYGGKDGQDDMPLKTFILNYNNYAATVQYEVNGEVRTYTVPANRYVMIQY